MALCFYGQKKAGQILEDIYREEVINIMSSHNANVLTLAVGDEFRREIASFVAGETEEGPHITLPVTDDYPRGATNRFQGKIHRVRVDLEEDNVSYLEPEDQKYHRIMAQQ